jgi:hypothetical protein
MKQEKKNKLAAIFMVLVMVVVVLAVAADWLARNL